MVEYDANYIGLWELMYDYNEKASEVGGARQADRYKRNTAIADILRDSIGEDGSGTFDLSRELVTEKLEARGIKKGLSPAMVFESLRTVKSRFIHYSPKYKLK